MSSVERAHYLKKTIAVCVGLVVWSILIAVPPARAATYLVDSCQRPDGSVASREGWTPQYKGGFVYYADNCSSGGNLDAAFDTGLEHDFGDYGAWTFSAPPATTLARLTALRGAQAARDRPYGSPVTFIRADSTTLEVCGTPYNCTVLSGEIDYSLGGARAVTYGIECGGAPGGRCPAGLSGISLRRMRITLNDNTTPTVSRAPTGTLTSAVATLRTRTLSYTASDTGGGVYKHRLIVDGNPRIDETVESSGARCTRHSTGSFDSPTPCPLNAGGTLTLDTAVLPDGQHEVKLEVFDATAANKASEGPWPITVDNLPPTVGDVSVSGLAREGETLQCSATVDGQTPRLTYQWLRAGADGSNEVEIAAATASTYTLNAGDVGKKVLCRVTGTDGGGSAVKKSSLTSGPFTGGAVVAAKPDAVEPKDRGPIGPSGANGSAGGNGSAGINGGSGADALAKAAAIAAVPACTTATVKLFGTVTSLTRSYNRSAVPLSGRLIDAAGVPRSGTVLDIVQTVVRAGTAQRKKLGSVSTGADGGFRLTAPRGPSRALQIVDPTCGAVGPIVTERVRGAVQAKTTTRRLRNRQTARIAGRVLGGYVGRGIGLELQVKVGRRWRDVKHTTSNARGEFKVGYRFTRTYVRYTYQFRMVTRAGGAWPYMPAKSRVVKVRVN